MSGVAQRDGEERAPLRLKVQELGLPVLLQVVPGHSIVWVNLLAAKGNTSSVVNSYSPSSTCDPRPGNCLLGRKLKDL